MSHINLILDKPEEHRKAEEKKKRPPNNHNFFPLHMILSPRTLSGT